MSGYVPPKPTLAMRLEYAALRVASTLVRPLGFFGASRVGAMIGALGWRPLRIRADRVERAVRACFPEFSDARVREVAKGSYASMGRMAMEIIYLSKATGESVLDKFVEPEGWELIERQKASGKGVLLVAAHFGNWELSGAYVAARTGQIEGIAMHMANPYSDAFLKRTRERLGTTVTFDEDAVRRIPRVLRDGNIVALVSDQGAKGLAATYANFFGRPARTPRGAAVFALRNGPPLLFFAAVRQPDARYKIIVREVPIANTGNRERDVDQTVQNYTDVIEQFVREYPEQYFWQHRRWKRQPPDTPPHLREP